MKNVLVYLILIIVTCLNAVTVSQIVNNPQYLWGDAKADDKETADKLAIKDLMSQISTNVESSFIDKMVEIDGQVHQECELEVKSYSSEKLYNTQRIIDETSFAPKIYVLRYIKKSEVENIFRERETRVNSLILEGEIAEEDCRITDAMRNYYWAYALLPTIPKYKQLEYCFNGNDSKNCYTGLENKINYLLNNIKFVLQETSSDNNSNFTDLIVKAVFDDQPVCGILVFYNYGSGVSEPAKWSNGIGRIRLSKNIAQTSADIPVYIDYTYREHAYDEDVIKAIDEMKYNRLPAAEKSLSLKSMKSPSANNLQIKLADNNNSIKDIDNEILDSVKNIAELIEKRKFGAARQFFTLKGYQDFNKLIDYGNAEFIQKKFELKISELNGCKIVRSLPMMFTYSGHKEPFTENVNLIFNDKGKVEKLTFALSDKSISDIFGTKDIAENDRQNVLNFMEMYKTAYCLKDLDFLDNVFAEDALIISGTVLEKDPEYNVEGIMKQLGDEKVKYIKMNKHQFINRLQKQFNKKEFINLQFADTNLRSLSNTDNTVFGIQIEQYYYSNNYADNGYLFLMFNLNDPAKPRITVRSWQPQKFDDGKIVGLEEFRF